MRTLATLAAIVIAVSASVTLGAIARAQETSPTPSPSTADRGMMNRDMKSMMDIMGQMHEMMLNCNRMMQIVNDRRDEKSPTHRKRSN